MLKDNTKLIITLGFGAVLALMFVLVFIAITQLQSLNTRLSSLVDDTYAKTEAANTMRDAIRLRASALTAMQLSDDAFERDEHFMRLPDYARMYRKAREVLLAKGLSKRERDIHSRLTEATRDSQPTNERAAELLRNDASSQETPAVVRKAAAQRDILLSLLDELVALERANAEEVLEQSRTHYREVRNAMFLLAGSAFVLGLVIAALVISQAAARTRQISYHASHDRLTGFANRHELEYRIQQAIRTARHDGVEHALLYRDLDQFELVNDTGLSSRYTASRQTDSLDRAESAAQRHDTDCRKNNKSVVCRPGARFSRGTGSQAGPGCRACGALQVLRHSTSSRYCDVPRCLCRQCWTRCGSPRCVSGSRSCSWRRSALFR